MTRPALRMCARCERTTEEPVLVHEVHAPTGPGFNVYVCPECAVHYPPPTDVLDIIDSRAVATHVDVSTVHMPEI
jgi:hypothetical protein